MSVNDTALLEGNKRDIGFANYKLDAQLVLTTLFNTTVTTKAASVTLFALDAIGGSIKDIKLAFFLDDDVLATFTVAAYKTRAGDLVTFIQDMIKTWSIALPAADGVYSFDVGDLEEGLQLEIRVAQDNAGDVTNVIDATLTYLG